MGNFSSTRAMPYVYQCVDKVTGEFYIGYREANVKRNRPSTDDFPKYKTSSKLVRQQFENFDWTILAEFFNGDDAWVFEQSLIRDNWHNPLLLNANYQFDGIKKIRNKGSNKGKVLGPHTAERRAKNSASQLGLKRGPHSDDHKEKIGAAQRGIPRKPHTEEWKRKHSEILMGRPHPHPSAVCPHCNKTGNLANMARWHFDNCKAIK